MIYKYLRMKFNSPKARIVLFLIVLFIAHNSTFAQKWKLRRYEVSLNLGTAQAFGDFGTKPNGENWFGLRDINIMANRPAFGFSLRYKIDQIYSVSLNGTYGRGYGNDGPLTEEPPYPDYYVSREFQTNIYEFGGRFEYFLITEDRSGMRSAAMFNRRGMINNYKSLSAYAFLGISGIYVQPDCHYRDPDNFSEHDLENYIINNASFFNLAIPIGIAGRYILNDKWILGAEVGWRWLATDYLDGFTTNREATKHNDVYYFLLFNVTHRMKTTRRGLPAFMDRSFRSVRRSKRAI